jgi:nitric oxide reductase activation protein
MKQAKPKRNNRKGRKYEKPVSLWPMTPEEALRKAMSTSTGMTKKKKR